MSKRKAGTPPPADYGHGASGRSVSNEKFQTATEFDETPAAGKLGFGLDLERSTAEAQKADAEFAKDNPGARG
jgi:hypothetical protein